MTNDKACLAGAREHFDKRYYEEARTAIAYCWNDISKLVKDANGVKYLKDVSDDRIPGANCLAIKITDLIMDYYLGIDRSGSSIEEN